MYGKLKSDGRLKKIFFFRNNSFEISAQRMHLKYGLILLYTSSSVTTSGTVANCEERISAWTWRLSSVQSHIPLVLWCIVNRPAVTFGFAIS